MKLTKKGINILQNDISLRNRIALLFDCSEASVRRWVIENEDNGDLTKFEAIQLIKKETKLEQSSLYEK